MNSYKVKVAIKFKKMSASIIVKALTLPEAEKLAHNRFGKDNVVGVKRIPEPHRVDMGTATTDLIENDYPQTARD